jgi:hypothetical protein
MPEEIAIIVVVLAIAGWLIVKIIQVLARSVDEIQKTCSKAIEQHKRARYSGKRSSLSKYIRVLLPHQLESSKKLLDSTENQFNQFQATTKWEAHRPTWIRLDFPSLVPAAQILARGGLPGHLPQGLHQAVVRTACVS